ncbi:MAG: hypothetical protein IPP76_01160 [Moraxellaceae bacterium]|nr:hypothetical protein [Moraxellaceae bacterium]
MNTAKVISIKDVVPMGSFVLVGQTEVPFEPAEFEDDAWDIQMKQDAKAGKLDALGARALEHYRAGRVTEI